MVYELGLSFEHFQFMGGRASLPRHQIYRARNAAPFSQEQIREISDSPGDFWEQSGSDTPHVHQDIL